MLRSQLPRLLVLLGVFSVPVQAQFALGPVCVCETSDSLRGVRWGVDTCGLGELDNCRWEAVFLEFGDSLLIAQGRLYANGRFLLQFPVGAMPFRKQPPDTTLIEYWRSIDTAFGELRDSLYSIERSFGSFTLSRVYPRDSAGPLSQVFICRFDTLVRVDLALARLGALPSTTTEYLDGPKYPLNAPRAHRTIGSSPAILQIRPGYVQVYCPPKLLPTELSIIDPLGRRFYHTLLMQSISDIYIPSSIAGAHFVVIGRSVFPITFPRSHQ